MHIDTELDCGACRLRSLREGDIPALAWHGNNLKVSACLRDRFPHPYTTQDGERFLAYVSQTPEECVAAIVVEDQVIGVIGLQFRTDIERCSAELGYWIGEQFWGRGIATAAITTFIAWAMPRFFLTRIYAEVFTQNSASCRVLEKAGFVRIGLLRKAAVKNGSYHDYVLYDFVK